MVWVGANYPQEFEASLSECAHQGVKYHIRDDEGIESISCVDCIADELETELKQGVIWRWEIQRLTDDEDGDATCSTCDAECSGH